MPLKVQARTKGGGRIKKPNKNTLKNFNLLSPDAFHGYLELSSFPTRPYFGFYSVNMPLSVLPAVSRPLYAYDIT